MNAGRAFELARAQMLRRVGRAGAGVVVLLLQTLALANPADPQTLEEVNRSRRAYEALTRLESSISNASEAISSSKESISKTILLLAFKTLSVERVKTILKWSGPGDPLFKPGVVPEGGYLEPVRFIFDRVQNWQALSEQEVKIEIFWLPVSRQEGSHYIETQWYRKDGDIWYLCKQDRRQIPGCNKWPRCVAEEA